MVEEGWEESLQSVFAPLETSKAFFAVTLVDQIITSSFPSFPLAHSTLLHRREKEKNTPPNIEAFLCLSDSKQSVWVVCFFSGSFVTVCAILGISYEHYLPWYYLPRYRFQGFSSIFTPLYFVISREKFRT